MFIELLKSDEEKNILSMLCFAVAIAEPYKMEQKAKEYLLPGDTYYFAPSANRFTTIALKNSKFLSIFGMKDAELELFEKISDEIDVGIYHINKLIQKAEENFHKMPEYQEIFKEAISFSLAGTKCSFKSQKIILFEMSNMAFCDGNCSSEEMAILHTTGEIFGLDAESIEEIINKSETLNKFHNQFTKIYNQAVEIICE